MLARACPSSVKSYPAPKSPTNCNFCLRFGSHPTFIPESLPPDRPTFEPANVPTCLGPIPFPFKLLRTLLHAQKLNSFFSIGSALFAQKHPGGGRVSMWNSPSCGPRSQCLSGKLCCVLLGLRWRICGRFSRPPRFCDRGEGLHVESFVVRVACHHAALESLHEQEPRSKVRFQIGRQPHLIVYKCLLVNDAAAFLQTRQQAAGKFHVPSKIGLQPRHVVRFFVHPDDSGEFLCQFFHQLVRLELGIGLEVENQHVLPAKALAARIHELACTQENLNPRFVAFFILPFFLGLLFFRFFLGRALLVFLDAFL